MGLFHPFLDDEGIAIYGVEAGGTRVGAAHRPRPPPSTAASQASCTGNRTYLLQNDDGQIIEGHSISAGLDYPGIGPEHTWLEGQRPASHTSRPTMPEALEAFQLCTKLEGIIPALEPAHALAYVTKLAPTLATDNLLVMNLCGRGDKDVFAVAGHLGMEI